MQEKEAKSLQDLQRSSSVNSEPGSMVEDAQVLFCGNFHHLLDDKGRVSLPATFRSFLEEKNETHIVLTNYLCDGARCLDGYTLSAWKLFQAKLAKKSRFDPQLRQLENFYLARSSMCAVDSSGRINIPTHLRTYAGLTKEVVFASALHGFRVWESKVWEMVFRESETALLQNPSLFMGIDQ